MLEEIVPVVALSWHACVSKSMIDIDLNIMGLRMDSTNLARSRLGKPQGPVVGQRVLDVEVTTIVEDGHDLAVICGGSVGG